MHFICFKTIFLHENPKNMFDEEIKLDNEKDKLDDLSRVRKNHT